MKTCARCLIAKDTTEYSNSKHTSDGLTSYCKSCQSAYYKAYNASRKAAQPDLVPQSKTCRDCGLEKPISQFGKRGVSLDKHQIYCKPCWRIRSTAATRKMRMNAKTTKVG